jgi:hypothetical protein
MPIANEWPAGSNWRANRQSKQTATVVYVDAARFITFTVSRVPVSKILDKSDVNYLPVLVLQ